MSLPPSEIPQGAIRFNTDSQRLEFYAQGEWWVMSSDTPNLASAGDVSVGVRGIAGGGLVGPASKQNVIDYWNLSSTGNSIDFGDLVGGARWLGGGTASSTRGLLAGGYQHPSPNSDTIEYITIASTGNSIDFGNLTIGKGIGGLGCSNGTRGIFGGSYLTGGTPNSTNVLDYVTIASTGNAVDFGDLLTPSSSQYPNTCASPTRGIFSAGSPETCLLYTSPSPRDVEESRMPSSA